MNLSNKRIAVAAIISISCANATAQLSDTIRELTSDFTNFLKDALRSNKVSELEYTRPKDPYKVIVGNWYDKNATITSTSTDPDSQRYNYSWNGQIIGQINERGEYIFRAENGCEITGKSIPFASATMWSISPRTTKCPFEQLNDVMAGRIDKDGDTITLRVDNPPIAMSRKLAYSMTAVMRRY